jgi:choline kinase
MRLIVLAAGRGTRLGDTYDGPKALVPLGGRPLLDWTLEAAALAGFRRPEDVVVIGGHRIGQLAGLPATLLNNPDYATTNMVQTLALADSAFGDGFVVSYGDIAYRPEVLRAVLASTAPISVAVELDWRRYWEARFDEPLADAETLRLRPDGTIAEIGRRPGSLDEIEGQYIGLVALRRRGIEAYRAVWGRALADAAAGRPVLGRRADLRRLYLTDVLDVLAGAGLVRAVPIHGGWVEIDTPRDRLVAEARWAASAPATAPASAPRSAPAARLRTRLGARVA